jgi:hypothetical protein
LKRRKEWKVRKNSKRNRLEEGQAKEKRCPSSSISKK